jgi:hypothetical protein
VIFDDLTREDVKQLAEGCCRGVFYGYPQVRLVAAPEDTMAWMLYEPRMIDLSRCSNSQSMRQHIERPYGL